MVAGRNPIGAIVYVKRDEEELKAELLLQRLQGDKLQFYVHFQGYNKRLDEWVSEDRVNFARGIEYPPPPPPEKENEKTKKKSKDQGLMAKKLSEDKDKDKDAPEPLVVGQVAVAEIEKLRTSGSMIQNLSEIARVRNISRIIFGGYEVVPWYFSPYPQELTKEDVIYICEYSFQYFGSKRQFERFRQKYTLCHPPGNEIYRDEKFSFFEIDGRLQRTWCRNLCLFSKLFLDHKTLYYDVDPFLFYCMTTRDEYGHHLVGYFSKEKESAENYNVACILSLPQYQRFGYGKVLIDFSYNLSKKEGKVGSPEKPLSDLGLISYRSYWSDILIGLLVESRKQDTTIEELSAQTAFTTADIMNTLQALNMLRYYRGQHIICLTHAAIERHERYKKKKIHRIDPEKLKWKPPVFTPAQLRFAW